MTAARRHLDTKRLESNRERVARTLGASSSSAAPAVGEKTGYIPKGYCVKWNKGTCTNDSCTYKHEKPPPKKDRSQSRPPSERGRSPSRDRNERTRKSSHVSFGNKADAIEVVSVDLAMRGSNQNLPVPRLLPGRPRMTRKDQDGRTAGAQAKAGIVLRSRRDLGVQGTAVPQRGIRVSLKRTKHPHGSGCLPDCIDACIRFQRMPAATYPCGQLPRSDIQHQSRRVSSHCRGGSCACQSSIKEV